MDRKKMNRANDDVDEATAASARRMTIAFVLVIFIDVAQYILRTYFDCFRVIKILFTKTNGQIVTLINIHLYEIQIFVEIELVIDLLRTAAASSTTIPIRARIQSVIAKTYLYLSQEYADLRKTFGGQIDLTSLAKFRRKMAKTTGLSQHAIKRILTDDEERNTSTVVTPPREQLPEEMETDKIYERDEKDVTKGDDVDVKDEINTRLEGNETEIAKSCDDETRVKLEKIHAEEDCSYIVVL